MADLNWNSEFPLREEIIYLNHAAVAPWPRRAVEAVQRFAGENMRQGSLDYPAWLETEQNLRRQLSYLLNAPSTNDIALVKNTSEALSFVAWGLDWRSGDNVVISDQEFPSNRIVWESLRSQGVELRQADLNAADTPEQALLARIDERTRLLATSSVQYGTGLRMDLARLGRFCRENAVLFCVDAIQSLGALQMDVQAIEADFVAADGHKWMLGPEGLGVFYCRAELRERLALHEFGWHMVEHAGDYDRSDWCPASDARRFECGSPNMLGAMALSASLGLLLEVGMENVERAVLARTDHLSRQLHELGMELRSPTDGARRAGIVTFRHPDEHPDALFQRLWDKGVVCAKRGGGIRLSPHFYTPFDALRAVIGLLDSPQ